MRLRLFSYIVVPTIRGIVLTRFIICAVIVFGNVGQKVVQEIIVHINL